MEGSGKLRKCRSLRQVGAYARFGWSHVLFPGSADIKTSLRLPAALILLQVAALLFFARLGCPLLEPDEARYAEIPREMLAAGHWLVPVLHGVPYYHKPPLLYWLVMAAYAVFGIHDWAARLVPCACSVLVVLVTYQWGKQTAGATASFAGALILALSVRFVYLGRMLTMDSLLCLWTVVALGCAHQALRGARLRWHYWLVSAAACGLGVLTKGPVEVVLVTIPVFTFQVLDCRAVRAGVRPWLAYLAVMAAVAGPWYAAVSVHDPLFAREFLWTHNVLRYVAPLDHDMPVWFYVPDLLLGMLPWSLLLWPLVTFLRTRSARVATQRTPELGFFLLCFLWCLFFYSLAGCKRPGYILPAMPPLALALGCFLDVVLWRQALAGASTMPARSSVLLAQWATFLVLVVAAGGSLLTVAVGMQKPGSGMVLTAAAGAGLWYLKASGPRLGPRRAWFSCGALTFAALLAGVHLVLPGYARKFSLRHAVQAQMDLARDQRRLVICYPHIWDSVCFYLGRSNVQVYRPDQREALIAELQKHSDTLLFVKSDDHTTSYLTDLLKNLPSRVVFLPRGHSGIVTAGLTRAQALSK